jgi:AraC-like DNA-binding protein
LTHAFKRWTGKTPKQARAETVFIHKGTSNNGEFFVGSSPGTG